MYPKVAVVFVHLDIFGGHETFMAIQVHIEQFFKRELFSCILAISVMRFLLFCSAAWRCDFPGRTRTNGDRKTVLISRRQTYTVNHYIGAVTC